MKKEFEHNPNQESALQSNLRKKMREVGISANALEKRAGLKRSAVQNILQGRSHRPSAQILHAITKILGSDINELLGNGGSHSKVDLRLPTSASLDLDNEIFNAGLYAETAKVVCEIFASRGINISKSKALNFIGEVYGYAQENKLQNVDIQFTQWLAKRWFGE